MVIYGVGLLAACLLAGLFIGDLLGMLLGVEAKEKYRTPTFNIYFL